MRRILPIIFSTLVLLIHCFAKDNLAPGSIRGEVVTAASDGEPAVLPHARIVLRGPANKETESDAQGAIDTPEALAYAQGVFDDGFYRGSTLESVARV